MRKLITTLLILSSFICTAQVRFVASQNAKQVLEGDYISITYTLYNARGSKLTPPSFDGFKRMGPPSQAFQSSNVNGKMSFQTAYTFSLLAQKTGNYKIGKASVVAEGKRYTSNTLNVEVIKREARPKDAIADDPVFVNLELSRDTAYLGQQVLLDYKLFTTIDVRNFDIRYEPEYENTYAVNVPTYNNFPTQREIINGVSYLTKVMKRVALFPMQYGTVVLEPASINLGIEYDDKNARSFFFRTKLKMQKIQTNEAALTILPLPNNAPKDFNGAVGKYNMRAYLTSQAGKTNEAISLMMTITGNGDEKRLLHPKLDFGENFDVYDPKVVRASNDVTGPIIKASKQLEYLIVPKKVGRFDLKPSFSYFDPDSAKYISKYQIIPIRIVQGSNIASTADPSVKRERKDEIRNIHVEGELQMRRNSFYASTWHFILLVIPFLVLGAGIIYKRHLIKEGRLDPSEVKNRRARKVALKRLEQAKIFKQENDARNFYDEISKASLGYVSDKYNLPASELSIANIQETIENKGYSQDIQNRFTRILKTAEMALFAGQTSAENLELIYQETLDLISEMES